MFTVPAARSVAIDVSLARAIYAERCLARRSSRRSSAIRLVAKAIGDAQLRQQGEAKAALYGADDSILGGLNAFYLLTDRPETYGLPSQPKLPSRSVPLSAFWSVLAALMTALGMLFAFRRRTESAPTNPDSSPPAPDGRAG